MSEYVIKTLKQKADKWVKFITGDERVSCILFQILFQSQLNFQLLFYVGVFNI